MKTQMRMGAVVAVVALCLSLGLVLGGPAADKHPELDKLKDADISIALVFKQTDIRSVFGTMERMGAFHFTYGANFPAGRKISCDFKKATMKEVLIQLAEDNGLAYEVPEENTLVIKGAVAKP